jgi:hypothetical protein
VSDDYATVRAEAQRQADEGPGALFRITKTYLGGYIAHRVPALWAQHGRDREGELVEPSDWTKCLRARGPGGATTTDPETAFHRRLKGVP